MNPDKPSNLTIFSLLSVLLVSASLLAQASHPPSPKEHFGFDLGESGRLLSWAELVGYYELLAEASPHLRSERIGLTTGGRPMLLLTLSSRSDEELRRLETHRRALLERQSGGDAATSAESVATMPAVVFVQGTLHSTEIAASLLFPDLLYRLATGEDESSRRIRNEVVLLIAPSANPDGIDCVSTWHEQTKHTEWEGTTPPELYQRFAGHDNNRDWFMLSLQETRLISQVLYRRWIPEVVLDIHQMGANGARMFVPPCSDPLNENIPALVTRQIDLVGAHMAWELQQAGCSGVVQDVVYDNYWAGGARNTPCRHNMVGIITETASARLASPITLAAKDLRGHGGGLPEYRRQGNFPDPWPGGTWTMRDILRYQSISTLAMLDLVARYRDRFVLDFQSLQRTAVRQGHEQSPFGFVLPAAGADPAALSRLVSVLQQTGVRVHEATGNFDCGKLKIDAGSVVVSLAQPFRNHAKDLLEVQRFPEVRFTRGGEVIAPYDSAAWCLPLQFGLVCTTLESPLPESAPLRPLTEGWAPGGSLTGSGALHLWDARSSASFQLAAQLRAKGVQVGRTRTGDFAAVLPADMSVDHAVQSWGLHVRREAIGCTPFKTAPQPRVAILKSWPASMDGGWTELVLTENGYAPEMITSRAISTGMLGVSYGQRPIDVLVIPDISAKTLDEGADRKRLPPEWQGGLAGEGVAELKRFANRGGRIVAMGSAAEWLSERLELPVENGLAKAPRDGAESMLCPGSLLAAQAALPSAEASGAWLLRSTAASPTIYFEGRFALRCTAESAVPVLNFSGKDLLRSGWIRNGQQLGGLSALVCCSVGKGHAILFAMRPQHRSQTLGTFRLLFEALEGP